LFAIDSPAGRIAILKVAAAAPRLPITIDETTVDVVAGTV
jgi:hypothetical protein